MSRNDQLSEQYIQDSFHSYLKSSLTQAKAERLLDTDVLMSAEADLMITGPALCLFFAALRCTTDPPSVPLPRSNKTATPMELSTDNCPPAFLGFLSLWARTVPQIQSLAPEHQHELARAICGLPARPPGAPAGIGALAADLRAVAIEISQRRSFQDRYADDLQAVLDASGGASGVKLTTSFVPPPVYEPSPPGSAQPSPSSSSSPLPPSSPRYAPPSHHEPPRSPGLLNPEPKSPRDAHASHHTLLAPDAPAIEFIRETLYAALADVIARQPSVRRLLARDPPRAYFASVALAILDVATSSMTPDGGVIGVLGTPLALADCPRALQPFMAELGAIGRAAREVADADDEAAVAAAQRGAEIPVPRMERVRGMLEDGVEAAAAHDGGRRSAEGRTVAFVNRVNALSLGMTRLPAFRERQEEVFRVLKGVGS